MGKISSQGGEGMRYFFVSNKNVGLPYEKTNRIRSHRNSGMKRRSLGILEVFAGFQTLLRQQGTFKSKLFVACRIS